MPPPPNASILLARAVGLIGRAEGLLHGAGAPEMRDALVAVALVAKDARAWLHELQILSDPAALGEVDTIIQAQGRRLDDLEDLLRLGANAKP